MPLFVVMCLVLPLVHHDLWGGDERPSEALLRKHVAFLAGPDLRGRAMLEDRRKAANYLIEEYRKLGLKPLFPGESYEQLIPSSEKPGESSKTFGFNIGALLHGSDPQLRSEWIILSAHYDHLPPSGEKYYPGADDNASSVAMVLEAARTLSQPGMTPKRSVAFVNFDLEEYLLWGSRWFVGHPPLPLEQLKLFITADLLGRNVGDLPLRMLFVMGSEHATEVARYLPPPPADSQPLHLGTLGIDIVGTRSDYGSFRDRDIPFLFFSTGQHPDYHTVNDRPEKLLYDKLAQVSGYITETVRLAANASETPKWIARPEPPADELKTLQEITSALLESKREPPLSSRQRLFVAQFDAQLRALLKRGSCTKEERSRVVRSAQWLLLTVF